MSDATKRPTFVSATERVRDLATEISYIPSDPEKELKALFTVALEENPITDWNSLSPSVIEELTKDPRIHKWWPKPGFREWFSNRHEFRAKGEFILDKLLDSFLQIALSDDPKSFGAKVQAAKVLAEITGKTQKAAKIRVLDAEIPDNPTEIKAMIKQLEAQVKNSKHEQDKE